MSTQLHETQPLLPWTVGKQCWLQEQVARPSFNLQKIALIVRQTETRERMAHHETIRRLKARYESHFGWTIHVWCEAISVAAPSARQAEEDKGTCMRLILRNACCQNSLAAQGGVYFSNPQTLPTIKPQRAQQTGVTPFSNKKKRFPQQTPACEIPPASLKTIPLTLRAFHIKKGRFPPMR